MPDHCFCGDDCGCHLIPGPSRPDDADMERWRKEAEEEAARLIEEIAAAGFLPLPDYERILYGTEPLSSANDESYGMGC